MEQYLSITASKPENPGEITFISRPQGKNRTLFSTNKAYTPRLKRPADMHTIMHVVSWPHSRGQGLDQTC